MSKIEKCDKDIMIFCTTEFTRTARLRMCPM